MVKYFKELEDKSNYQLPLINPYDDHKVKIEGAKIPITYLKKHKKLLELGTDFIKMFQNNKLDLDQLPYKESIEMSQRYEGIKEELDYVLDSYNKVDTTTSELESYLRLVLNIIRVYNYNQKYNEIEQKYAKAITELETLTTIKKTKEKQSTYLSDAWYILPNNHLYNTGKDGHKGTDLTYAYRDIKENIDNLETNKKSLLYQKEAKDIEKRGYVESTEFKFYLNYINQPCYLTRKNKVPVTYERHTVKTITGIVYANAYFYDFFERLSKSCNDSKSEITKLEDLTNRYIPDILVRCCGFHKVESSLNKKITTGALNYETIFSEYIEKGWVIDFIPPINIQNGKVEELDKDYVKIKNILKG